MSFIRKRGNSHQIIETYRDGGKVKQRIIANLGPVTTPEEAIEIWKRYIRLLQARLQHAENLLEKIEVIEREEGREQRNLDALIELDAAWRWEQDPPYLLRIEVSYGCYMNRTGVRKEVARWRRRVAWEQTNLDALLGVVSDDASNDVSTDTTDL